MGATADFNLLKFETYEDYLRSFSKIEEYRYLGNMKAIQAIVKLGYRSNTTVYEQREFYELKKRQLELINPKSKVTELFSNYLVSDDPALQALAKREERNVQGKLSLRQRSGFDISGYIDYADSLRHCSIHSLGATDWKAIFQGRILLRPNTNHLSFYDWHHGLVSFNNSDNYETMHHGVAVIFKHTGDHKLIPVTTADSPYKDNVTRTFIQSPLYGCMVLYDHTVRKA